MKTLTKTFAKTFAIAALTASFAAPAFAAVADDVRQVAATNGYIDVQVSGDKVTLNGFVEDTYARQLAENTARKQGYEVQNNLLLSGSN